MRVGILGGSFNPIHNGHLALANAAFCELNLDRLYFVPSFQTPLKDEKSLLPAQTRLKLLKKALKPYPHFLISTCEIEREGRSYTVDTLRVFKKENGPDTQIYFLTGMDSLENLSQWKSLDAIFKLCRFVVATRPGYKMKETEFPILRMPFQALNVSSTTIRRRVKMGEPLTDLVPEAISQDLVKCFSVSKKDIKPKKRGLSSKQRKK